MLNEKSKEFELKLPVARGLPKLTDSNAKSISKDS